MREHPSDMNAEKFKQTQRSKDDTLRWKDNVVKMWGEVEIDKLNFLRIWY